MVAALKKRGIEVEYLVKENEGHGFTMKKTNLNFTVPWKASWLPI